MENIQITHQTTITWPCMVCQQKHKPGISYGPPENNLCYCCLKQYGNGFQTGLELLLISAEKHKQENPQDQTYTVINKHSRIQWAPWQTQQYQIEIGNHPDNYIIIHTNDLTQLTETCQTLDQVEQHFQNKNPCLHCKLKTHKQNER